jgi:hypothetical protein
MTENIAKAAQDQLRRTYPQPPTFHTKEEIENLTDDQAMEVMRYVRRMLLDQLLFQEYHEHMLDDCGDYLTAASDNWTWLHDAYFNNDGEGFTDFVINWLTNEKDYPLGGSDGEARFDLLSEELMEELFYA